MREDSTIKMASCGEAWVARLEGRGTVRESPTLQGLATRILEARGDACVLLDLRGCEYLDSTFLGCIATLHRRFSAGRPQRFRIVAPEPVRARLFGPSGLDRVFAFAEAAPEPDADAWMDVPATALDERQLGYHVMDAHRRLAELGGPHALAFAAIAEQFALELGAKP